MRYFFAVIDNQTNSASSDEMGAIDVFNEKIDSLGHRIMAAGIVSPDEAVVVDNRGSKGIVSNGPVADSENYVSGFWIIEAPNDTVAQELALEASQSCNRVIEVRRFLR